MMLHSYQRDAIDRLLGTRTTIIMNSTSFLEARRDNMIEYLRDAQGDVVPTFRGLRISVNDNVSSPSGEISEEYHPRRARREMHFNTIGTALAPPNPNLPFYTEV